VGSNGFSTTFAVKEKSPPRATNNHKGIQWLEGHFLTCFQWIKCFEFKASSRVQSHKSFSLISKSIKLAKMYISDQLGVLITTLAEVTLSRSWQLYSYPYVWRTACKNSQPASTISWDLAYVLHIRRLCPRTRASISDLSSNLALT